MTEVDIEQLATRAEIYQRLSACYCLPGAEFIEEGLADGLVAALEPICPPAVPCAREMGEALAHCDLQKEILVDYSALFLGPFKLLAPPYGSVYLDREKQLLGDSTVDVVLTYRRAGVELDADQHKDMPDNIAVELEFIYFLMCREAEARSLCDLVEAVRYADIRRDFLRKHLGAWVFPFAEAVKKGARTPFYRHLASCTEIFLRQELDAQAA